jgi:hypothetical protein
MTTRRAGKISHHHLGVGQPRLGFHRHLVGKAPERAGLFRHGEVREERREALSRPRASRAGILFVPYKLTRRRVKEMRMRGRGKLFAVVDGEGGVPKPNFKILWEGRVPEWNWEPPGWGTVDERSKGLERHRFGFV